MEHFYQNIDGMFDFDDVYKDMINVHSDGAHFVEVGTYMGRSLAYLIVEIINSGKNIRVGSVDLWEDVQQVTGIQDYKELTFEKFKKNLSPVDGLYTAYRGFSSTMAEQFDDKSLDFVFIDADHAYESVKKDIEAYLPKIKIGGYIGGHDYVRDGRKSLTVAKAVREFFEGKIQLPDPSTRKSSWLVQVF